MYQRILVPVENSPYDAVILAHIRKLARACNDASIILIHVADGWAARNINQLDLRESEEMRADRQYIEGIAESLESDGYSAEAILAGGDPAKEIAAVWKRCAQQVENKTLACRDSWIQGRSNLQDDPPRVTKARLKALGFKIGED